jgi:hypothetical protein
MVKGAEDGKKYFCTKDKKVFFWDQRNWKGKFGFSSIHSGLFMFLSGLNRGDN